jgi:hypothetical protein
VTDNEALDADVRGTEAMSECNFSCKGMTASGPEPEYPPKLELLFPSEDLLSPRLCHSIIVHKHKFFFESNEKPKMIRFFLSCHKMGFPGK